MQTLLIASKNNIKIDDFLTKIYRENKVGNFDINIVDKEGTIGIGEVRELQKTLFLKPLNGETKAVILKNSQNLTIEAQNALLKILEEPPSSALIILTASQKELLLSTILSRCKIIEFKSETPLYSEEEISQKLTVLNSLVEGGVGEKLKLAQDFGKNKGEITWLQDLIVSIRYALLKRYSKTEKNILDERIPNQLLLDILKKIQKTKIILETTNTNPRLTLEHLFLDLCSK